jgi:hypothetical protein
MLSRPTGALHTVAAYRAIARKYPDQEPAQILGDLGRGHAGSGRQVVHCHQEGRALGDGDRACEPILCRRCSALSSLFVVEDRGAQPLKGIEQRSSFTE